MSTKQSKRNVRKTGTRQKHKQQVRKEQQAPVQTQSKQSKRQRREKRKQERQAGKKVRRRIFPIWLRLMIICLLCIVALFGGLMVGYGILGDGDAVDALKWETWQHIIDIVKKTE